MFDFENTFITLDLQLFEPIFRYHFVGTYPVVEAESDNLSYIEVSSIIDKAPINSLPFANNKPKVSFSSIPFFSH